jgi:APA family basic amino acid/polyamine antiporter
LEPFIFKKKKKEMVNSNSNKKGGVHKQLGRADLILLGLGGIIGSGIFALPGEIALRNAGPAVCISFIIAGICAGFTAFCYAELAGMIPVSGSAYIFAYEAFGVFTGWIIGWIIVLEYLLSSAVIAVSWSSYVVQFFERIVGGDGASVAGWVNAPIEYHVDTGEFVASGNYFNVPAVLIIVLLTLLLCVGIREIAWVNNAIVAVKVVVILIFVFVGFAYVNSDNWIPFSPHEVKFGRYGASGIFQGATIAFFAYLGFDSVCCTSSESKDPQKDMPYGIIGSLAISSILYILVCVVLTGLVSYQDLGVSNPISLAIQKSNISGIVYVIDIGAISGLTSALLVALLSQTRIFWRMAQEGLLPSMFMRLHPKYGTPVFSTLICGLLGGIIAALFPIGILAELSSIGTLVAFISVCAATIHLRRTKENVKRPFMVPGGTYLIPVSGILLCLTMISVSRLASIVRLIIWIGLGIVVYWLYGRKHCILKPSLIKEEDQILVNTSPEFCEINEMGKLSTQTEFNSYINADYEPPKFGSDLSERRFS